MKDKYRHIESMILGCTRCPRLRSVTPRPYPHIVYGDPVEILIIGRNPGLEHDYTSIATDDEHLKVYSERYKSSRFGRYLEIHLGNLVWSRGAVTNLCKCSSPENSPLTAEEISNCKPHLIDQLAAFSPKVIAVFGKEALVGIFGENFSGLMKTTEFVKTEKTSLFAFYHPSFILRYRGNEWAEDLNAEKFKTILEILR